MSTRRLVPLVVAVAVGLAVIAAAVASSSATYADPAGDGNEAPDIASVTIDDATPGSVTVRVRFANFQVLPPDSRVFLRFDLDRNSATGEDGDEAEIRFSNDGTFGFFRWDGSDMTPRPVDGMSATFADGVLAYTAERAQLGGAASFGLLAIAARTQNVGQGFAVATDFAPGSGRNVYSSPGVASYPDPDGDHDDAPDLTSIAVTDSAAGQVVVRVTTRNYGALPPDKLIAVAIDLRGRPASDDELFVGYLSGSRTVEAEREVNGGTRRLEGRIGITGSHANGVLTFSISRARLEGASAFDLRVASADIVGPGESEGQEFVGDVEGLDTAPDAPGAYAYRLANPGPLRFQTSPIVRSPAVPRAGAPFTVGLVVRRLDTYRVVRSGAVTCRASVAGRPVVANGRFRRGRAECTLQVPAGTSGRALRGTIAVGVTGGSHRSSYNAVVR